MDYPSAVAVLQSLEQLTQVETDLLVRQFQLLTPSRVYIVEGLSERRGTSAKVLLPGSSSTASRLMMLGCSSDFRIFISLFIFAMRTEYGTDLTRLQNFQDSRLVLTFGNP
jgi:hypothetical protein